MNSYKSAMDKIDTPDSLDKKIENLVDHRGKVQKHISRSVVKILIAAALVTAFSVGAYATAKTIASYIQDAVFRSGNTDENKLSEIIDKFSDSELIYGNDAITVVLKGVVNDGKRIIAILEVSLKDGTHITEDDSFVQFIAKDNENEYITAGAGTAENICDEYTTRYTSGKIHDGKAIIYMDTLLPTEYGNEFCVQVCGLGTFEYNHQFSKITNIIAAGESFDITIPITDSIVYSSAELDLTMNLKFLDIPQKLDDLNGIQRTDERIEEDYQMLGSPETFEEKLGSITIGPFSVSVTFSDLPKFRIRSACYGPVTDHPNNIFLIMKDDTRVSFKNMEYKGNALIISHDETSASEFAAQTQVITLVFKDMITSDDIKSIIIYDYTYDVESGQLTKNP